MANHRFSKLSTLRRCAQHLALAAALATSVGAAHAQAEPSLKQIYDTAQSGKVAEAQVMVQQVLTLHPKSAKAHFVQAELFARQGNAPRARQALAEADKLAPGLPFASATAVSALREQLAVKAALAPSKQALGDTVKAAAPAPASSSFPLGLGLALGGAAIGAAILFSRRKSATAAVPVPSPSAYGNAPASFNPNPGMAGGMGGLGGGLSGPQTFGAGTAPAPNYGNPAYGQPVPPAGGAMSGMGGRLAGGLATGLAVGAGVMAAQAIGNSFAHRNEGGHTDKPTDKAGDTSMGNPGSLAQDAGQPLAGNQDFGGQNFGMNESAGNSWDDAGSADSFSADAGDAGGGGDWDT
ncbi:MAG: tetratricopeptide repeat protein [Polaromonas sp.]